MKGKNNVKNDRREERRRKVNKTKRTEEKTEQMKRRAGLPLSLSACFNSFTVLGRYGICFWPGHFDFKLNSRTVPSEKQVSFKRNNC